MSGSSTKIWNFHSPTNSEHKFYKGRIENLLSIVFELGFLWLGTQWMGLPLLITRILTNNGVGESKKIIYLAISTILVDCSWLVVVKITLIVSRKFLRLGCSLCKIIDIDAPSGRDADKCYDVLMLFERFSHVKAATGQLPLVYDKYITWSLCK